MQAFCLHALPAGSEQPQGKFPYSTAVKCMFITIGAVISVAGASHGLGACGAGIPALWI